MPIYTCILCYKEFKQKSNYDKHIQRLNLCTIIIENPTNNVIDKDLMCCCCNKVFSSKSNLFKHEKIGTCFLQKLLIEEKKEQRIKELEEENKKIEEENRLLKLSILTNNNIQDSDIEQKQHSISNSKIAMYTKFNLARRR